MTSYLPVTVDGTTIPADAPRSQSMTDDHAAALAAFADEYRSNVMHLHSDTAGRDVTLTAANCPEGEIAFTFGDGSYDVTERVADGETPTAAHTYLVDGVYTAQLHHSNGDRAQLQVAVNWPHPPEEVVTP